MVLISLLSAGLWARANRRQGDASTRDDPADTLKEPAYAHTLRRLIKDRMAGHDGLIAVYVKDLDRGEEFAHHADRRMYLASGIKMLFLVELFRQRDAGLLSFDEALHYSYRDFRDGAPAMNRRRAGEDIPIRELITYMIRDSDNAATDMLLSRITPIAVERGLLLDGRRAFGPVVTMLDARLGVYTRLDPRAADLKMWQVRDTRWRDGHHPRLDLLQKHIGPPYKHYDEADLDDAYTDYYALGRNHASMRMIGDIYTDLARGRLISASTSREILDVLEGAWSSGNRIRGAVPSQYAVAHKTGTQHRRICDLALTTLPDGRQLIIAIAMEGLPYDQAEPIMQAVARRAWTLAADQKLATTPSSHDTRMARRAP